MAGAYAYTPDIWLPLLCVAVVAAMGLYGWRRRDVPAGKPFAALALFGVLLLLGIAFETAAVTPAAKIAWNKFQFLFTVLAVTSGTCFSLEYAHPGRWLTRRNLILLSIVPLLTLVLTVVDDALIMGREFAVAPDGAVVSSYAISSAVVLVYVWALVFVNAAVFIWLFVRSPQHRWPVAIMLFGQFAGRAAYLLNFTSVPAPTMIDPTVLAVLATATAYFIALFGFRIFDPLPTARRTVIEQMQAGVMVFDAAFRVVSLNPAAEKMLGTRHGAAHGKTWQQLAPRGEVLPALPDTASSPITAEANLPEITLGTGAGARQYALALSELRDFRGLLMGHVLMLRDVTDERRAQAQMLEQQRSLAVMRERERLARELHDSTGQVLGYAGLQLEVILDRITDGLAALSAGQGVEANTHLVEAENHAARLSSIVEEAHADVREHILNLRLAPSDQRPFFAALRHYLDGYCQNYGIQTELSVGPGVDERKLAARTQTELFRIIQESLSNARKHAEASCVQISFETQDGQLCIQVQDNGRGFDPALPMSDGAGHFGLRTMHERAEKLGGNLRVQSAPGAGTCVVADLPIDANQGEERP